MPPPSPEGKQSSNVTLNFVTRPSDSNELNLLLVFFLHPTRIPSRVTSGACRPVVTIPGASETSAACGVKGHHLLKADILLPGSM